MPSWFRKSAQPKGYRVFFATDVHGSEACFRKFLNAREVYRVDDLILGGDMTGKHLIPITRLPSGRYYLRYGDTEYGDIDDDALAQVSRLIRDHGNYPYVASADEIAELQVEATRDAVFRRCVYEVASGWAQLAEERLKGTGARCFMAPGNDDFLEIDSALMGGERVVFAENQCLELTPEHDMITTGYSNITPWDTERELDEDVLSARIDAMAAQARAAAGLVAVLHVPPYNCSIDQAPELNSELQVSVKVGAGLVTAPVGSTAVREFIESRQPLLGLHGHVHEGLGSDLLGRTTCLNPGSEYTTGRLAGVIVELEPEKVRSFHFVSG
jgi:uncharacterized protein